MRISPYFDFRGTTLKHPPGESLATALGEVIRDLRQSHGLSQQDLAERANLHRTYVSDIENSKRNISLGTLELLAKSLEISVAEMLGMAEEKSRSYSPTPSLVLQQ